MDSRSLLSNIADFFRSRFFWLNLALLLIVIALLIAGSKFLMKNYTRFGETVLVPDLRGQTVDELNNSLDGKKLNFLVYDSTFVSGMNPMEVLEQEPLPGSKVKEGRRIYLTVNARTAPLVAMPNLIDASLKDARLQLENKQLQLGKITYRPHIWNVVMEMRHAGRVVKSSSEIQKGSKIDLIVGDGKGVNNFTLGSFVGLPYEEAISAIRLSDLNVGKVNWGKVTAGGKGYVFRQHPPSGSSIIKGDQVDIYLKPLRTEDPLPDSHEYKEEADKIRNRGKINGKGARKLDFNNPDLIKDVIKKTPNR